MYRLSIIALGIVVSGLLTPVSHGVAKETDGDIPLTGVSASLQPDLFTGTLTGSIPIVVPPGRNGMQPNLALVYESAGGNSWLGMGWKLEMGAIERQTRWGVRYSPTPAEEQAGKVYTFRLSGVSTDLVQDSVDLNLYRAKIEGSFERIKKLPAGGWEVTDKKGTKYYFGRTTPFQIQDPAVGIFKWCLERVEDRNGNYMTMAYTPNQGQGYLSQIDYTGNGAITPTNQVKFYLEDRSDAPDMYTSYFKIKTAKRLKTIEVKANGVLVRAYKMGYEPNTMHSHLNNITEFGKDALLNGSGDITNELSASKFPSPTIGWTPNVLSLMTPAQWLPNGSGGATVWHTDPANQKLGDFNGDGKMDYMWISDNAPNWWVALSNGTTFDTPTMWLPNGSGGATVWHAQTARQMLGDFNGDGKTDYFWMPNGTQNWWVALSNTNGTTFDTPTPWLMNGTGGVQVWASQAGRQMVGDLNGDGKTDYMWMPDGQPNWWVALSNGTTLDTPTMWLPNGLGGATVWHTDPANQKLGDFNGDGKMDYMWISDNAPNWWVALSNGTTFDTPTMWLPNGSGGATVWHAQTARQMLGDFNGDGKTDYFWMPNGTQNWWVALSKGTTFDTPTMWLPNGSGGATVWHTEAARQMLGDFNGDGKIDYFWMPDGSQNWWMALSTGEGFVTPAPWLLNGAGGTTVSHVNPGNQKLGDLNGDGKTDYMWLPNTTPNWWVSYSLAAMDHVASLSNGLGGITRVFYTPSPQHSTTSTPAHSRLPYPVQTVTNLSTCDNWNSTTSTCAGTSSTTIYSYTGGYHHISERDFRGFKTAVVTSPGATDADKTLTTTWFHQGNELNPIDTENQGLANGYMKGKPYRVEVKRKSDNFLYTKTETTYHDDRIGANTSSPWFTPPSQVDTVVCDGGPCVTMQVTIAATDYDSYGNVLRESHHGSVSVLGDEKTIQREFLINTTDYVVNAPKRERIYKGVSVAIVDKLAETLFYYDGTGTGACTAAPTGSNTAVTKGKLTKVERWLSGGTNPISGMEYDSITGVLFCSRDPLGNKTTLTYDPTKTFVLTTTNQLGHVTTTVYSGVNLVPIDLSTGFYGTVKSVTDPNGKVVNYKYDALGRKTETLLPDGLVTQVTYPTLAEYGLIDTQKISTTTSGGNLPASLVSSVFFDGLGRTITKESSGPNSIPLVTKTEYDVKGQVFRTSLPYFKTTESVMNRWRTMSYDALGRVVQVTHPDTLSGTQLISKSCYAPFVTVMVEADGDFKRETKDAYGRVVRIEEYDTIFTNCGSIPTTPYATTNYTYDLLGNLTKVVDALGNRTTMRYDTLSRKIGMSDPDMSTNGTATCTDLTTLNPNATYPWYSAPCWNYEYYPTGDLKRQTDAKNQTLWFRYDGLNRRSQKDFTTQKTQGSGDVVYVYDDTVNTFNRKGRLRQVTDAATNVTFEYDAMGRISKSTKVLDGTTYVTTSVYDGLGRLKEVTYPGATPKTIEYIYTGPVLERVRDKTGSGTTIYAIYSNYTSHGQVQTITYGNGVVTTRTFADPAHSSCIPANSFKLCTLKTQKGTNPLYQDLTYKFTADGNMDLITDPINGDQDFGYDNLDRLTSATGPYGTGGATTTLTYTYNQIGNMLTNSQVGTYSYPTSGAGVVRPHAVTAAGANTYSNYDNNGNLLTGAGRIYAWNLENKPTCIAQATGTCSAAANKTTYVYDGDGGRVKKIVGTTTTRYISKLYECDTTGTTTSCSRFIWGGSERIATVAVTGGTVHYWHGDHLGSSSVVTDSTGAKVQALTYYPYGATRTNVPGTPINVPYKFTGKELDSTGLYYYEARYYDPTLGRFISPDTIVLRPGDPQELNRYTYAKNNPMLYTDPTGNVAIIPIIVGIFVTAAVSTVTSVAIAAATGGDLIAAAKYGAVSGAITGGLCPGGACSFVAGFTIYAAAGAAASAALGLDPGAGAAVGAIGFVLKPVCTIFCAGAAAGAVGAAIQGGDIGQGALSGFIGSSISVGVGVSVAVVAAGVQAYQNLHDWRNLRPDFFAEDVEVCSASSGCGPKIKVPVKGGIVGESRGLWTPAEVSIDATILRLQLQYTIGRGLSASDVTPGDLALHMQMSVVAPGAQPSGVSIGPLTVYGTYNGGNFHFRGTGVSGGWGMLGNVPQVSTPR